MFGFGAMLGKVLDNFMNEFALWDTHEGTHCKKIKLNVNYFICYRPYNYIFFDGTLQEICEV